MKKKTLDIEELMKEISSIKFTTFNKRVYQDRISDRANAILEYLNGYIIKEQSPVALNSEIALHNKFWGTIRREEVIYQSDVLTKFDAYILHSMIVAVNRG